jgi:ubiquinone/menaquinone biosynthesis C-methylase UbiE
MAESQIRYDDATGYERSMGHWSRLAGETFLDWLAPPPGLRWIDVGCGSGAFTELIVDRCAPAEVQGIDPAEAQLAFAHARPAGRIAEFRKGDAMALPFADRSFDMAVMALVIFFVPDPAKGVAEMMRTVRPGGMVTTYVWDMFGGGFPMDPIQAEMRTMGLTPVIPPSSEASRMDALRALWTGVGLDEIVTREITVQRTFADFDDFWTTSLLTPSMRAAVSPMTSQAIEQLKTQVRKRLPADAAGHITSSARANAIRGRVPLTPHDS